MRLGQWVKHFLVYGTGIILMNLLPALMIPIYTYRITPSMYGVLELLNRSQEVLIVILSFGLGSAVATFYQMERDNPEGQKAVYSTSVQFVAVFSLIIVLCLLVLSSGISRLLFGSVSYRMAIVLILLSTYFEVLFQSGILYFQSELRSSLYVSIYAARSILSIFLNLILVFWWRWGLIGILTATLIQTSISGIAVVAYMFQGTGFRFQRKVIGHLLRFGGPLVIGGFAMFILNNGDRYFLKSCWSSADVGIYGIGYRLGAIGLAVVLYPFMKIWSVTMVDISRRPDGHKELSQIATYLIAACIFTNLALALFGPYLVEAITERSYWGANRLVPVIGLAYVFYAWSVIMDASFYVTKKTVYKICDTTLAAGVILLLYWWLIPRYEMMGAAWATVGGFASFAGIKSVISQRVLRIPFEFGRIGCLFGIGIILYLIGAHMPTFSIVPALVARSAVTIAFPIILWLGGFMTPNERRAVEEYWDIVRVRYLGGEQT